MTQTVTVAPNATPQAIGQPVVTPATGPAAVPAGVTAPAAPAVPVVPTPAPSTITPATSGTITEYFASKGVALEPQSSRDFRALNIVLPMPRGWAHIPDPNVPDAFAVIADRVGGNGLYSSNAQVVVYKLVGEFDPKEAISHGLIDSQQLPAWRSTDASLADFGGMPVVADRRHLPRERHDAEHVAPARHRHLRPRPLPGVAGGDHQRRPGRAPPPTPPTRSSTASR